MQVRGGRYSVSVDARVEGRPKAIGLPKEPPKEPWPPREVWVFAADETAAAGRALRPHADRPLAHRAARGVARAARVPRRARREPQPSRRCGGARPSRRPTRSPSRASCGSTPTGAARASATTSAARCARRRASTSSRPGRSAASPSPARTSSSPPTPRRRRPASSCAARPCSSRPTRASPSAGAIPAVGWTTGVEQLQATLHVPPGWSLLGATGVDRLPGTWTSRWTLLGFFFVLIVTLAVHRLFGLRPALLALAALVLTHGEPGAPSAVWLSLVAAIALQRVAPAGRIPRLARLWFLASAAVLVVLVVPFARDQVKDALFPQVAEAGAASRAPRDRSQSVARASGVPGGVVGGAVGGVPAAAPAAPPQASAEDKPTRDGLRRGPVDGSGAGDRRAAGLEARRLLLQHRPRAGPEGRAADRPRRPGLDLAQLLPHVERTRGPRPHDAALPRSRPG